MRTTGMWLESLLLSVVTAIMLSASLASAGDILAWPIRDEPSLNIRGTYGDCRVLSGCDIRYQLGVDLHANAWTDVYCVKGGSRILENPNPNAGEGHLYCLSGPDGSGYYYGHVGLVTKPGTDPPRPWGEDDIIWDTVTPFCEVWDWGSPGWSYDDHMEFGIITPGTGLPKNNPICQFNPPGYEYLPLSVSPGAKIGDGGANWWMGVTFGSWVKPNCDNTAKTPNKYFFLDKIPSGDTVDVFVYANTKASNGLGPVGVCKLEMAVTETQNPPTSYEHVLDYSKELPSTAFSDYVFGVEELVCKPGQICPIYPQTIESTYWFDSMWYIITNFDEDGIWRPDEGHLPIVPPVATKTYWIWLRVTDHIGNSASYPSIEVVFHGTPAAVAENFRARSTEEGIVLAWDALSLDQVDGFRVCRSEDRSEEPFPLPGSWVACSGFPEDVQEFQHLDSHVVAGATYWYSLEARFGGDEWFRLEPIISASWRVCGARDTQYFVEPNPFRSHVEFHIPISCSETEGFVVSVFDCSGRKVWSANVESGTRVIRWSILGDGRADLVSGIYFCQLRGGGFSKTVKALYLE